MHFVREKVAAGALRIQYLPTEHQCADILTKALPASRFAYLKSKLNLHLARGGMLEGKKKTTISKADC